MMNVLITGASGMLGAALVNEYKNHFNVFATGNSNLKVQHANYKKFDLKSESYDELIEWSNPDIIIHSGALTNANYCEDNPKYAFDINGISVQKFLKATRNDVKIIYISTDAVFPSSIRFANEEDCVFPENVYGKSKELGEFFLRTSLGRNYTIIRTTIVGLNTNRDRTGFVEWIINMAKNDKPLKLFTDVLFCPISIWDLAIEIKYLMDNDINAKILHISGELCNKYEFGYKVLETLGISTQCLSNGSISSFASRANRSNDQSLDSSFYKEKYKRKLPSLNEVILNIKTHYENNKTRNENS